MESIASTQMHRNKAQELFAYYDEKYIQKWVLHDEAVDLMVLKVQKITMEDHYAKLYGPRIIAHQKIESSSTKDDSTKDTTVTVEDISIDPIFQKTSHDILLKAFSSHPYHAYKNQPVKRMDSDSQENIQKMLKEEERKATMIWKKAFLKASSQTSIENLLSKDENAELQKQNERRKTRIFEIYSQVRDKSNIVDTGEVDLNPSTN